MKKLKYIPDQIKYTTKYFSFMANYNWFNNNNVDPNQSDLILS